MVPEAQTAILRTAVTLAGAIVSIVGAIRSHRRWMGVLLAIVAVPVTLFAMFGMFVASLILRYGPRQDSATDSECNGDFHQLKAEAVSNLNGQGFANQKRSPPRTAKAFVSLQRRDLHKLQNDRPSKPQPSSAQVAALPVP